MKPLCLTLLTSALLMGGCAKLPEPVPGNTMRDVYNQKAYGGSGTQAANALSPAARVRGMAEVSPHYPAYTRDVHNETRSLFPRLPNPTLFMYVRPRVVGEDGLPVPGYTIPFNLYERDQHALPGEYPTDHTEVLRNE